MQYTFKNKLIMDYELISNVEMEEVDMKDYPDLCDAYVSYAEYNGEPMSEEQLEEINEDLDFVHEQALESLQY